MRGRTSPRRRARGAVHRDVPCLRVRAGDGVRAVPIRHTRLLQRGVSRTCPGLKGGNFVRIAGVEVGKVKNLTLQKDGTVTVDFAIDKGLTTHRGHQGGGALRKPHRRPLSGPRRRAGLGAETAAADRRFRLDADLSCSRRRRSHRRLPATVPCVGSRPGQRVVRPTAEGVPGPGRHHLVGARPRLLH